MKNHLIRVLLVEDDEDYCKLVDAVLRAQREPPFQLNTAGTLADAFVSLDAQLPDVILLDLNLPDCQRFETFARIYERVPSVPIAILTGSENPEMGVEAVSRGAQDYLVKQNVRGDSLVRCLRYAIERKRAEDSRLRLEAIEDFMAMLAHDLKVPILGADRVLESLLSGELGPLDSDQVKALSLLQTSNSRVLEKVQRLLEIYSYESMEPMFSFESVDLRKLVSACIAQYTFAAGERSLHIANRLDAADAVVRGNKAALGRLFGNLLDNAVKYSLPGRNIDVSLERNDDSISVSIRNFGQPIPPRDLAVLFQRFWQGEPGKRYVASTGLGLYLCKRIADLHGGSIQCSSTRQAGTVFTVLLPAHHAGQVTSHKDR
jgi:signal transduction histidine kinase